MHLLADILGKKNTQRLNGNSVSHLLVTALLGCSALTTGSVVFNQHVAAIAQEQSVSFSISAQPLSSAIREFIATTGWQISYSSDAVAGKHSSGVSGNMSPEAALKKLISGTGLQLRKRSSTSVALLPFGSKADTSADSELLDEVVVYANTNPSNTESLFGDGDPRAIGKTIISRSLIETGGDAGGDINSQLKTLPNVQWQNHTSTNAGDTATSEQDLRPGQYSISGGDFDANLFVLDGIDISSRGTDYGSDSRPLHNRSTLLVDALNGSHPQTLYVPDNIVDSITVHDSNISARYGGFRGGVVEVNTVDPTSDRWSGWLDIGGTGSGLTKFNIVTPNGDNPTGAKPYKFLNLNGSIGLSGPIGDGLSFLTSVTNQYSRTSRERDPQFINEKKIETATNSTTLLNKLKIERDWGTLGLSSTINFYDQLFESHKYLMEDPAEISGNGSSTKLSFNKQIEDFSKLSNIELDANFSVNTSKKGTVDSNTRYTAASARSRLIPDFVTGLSDKCKDIPELDSIPCNFGGMGDLTQSETKIGTDLTLSADWNQHSISIGAGATRIFASRNREKDLELISAVFGGTFTCADPENDPLCYDNETYANSFAIFKAYDSNVALTELNFWGEAELNWGQVELRPGLRVEHDNFLNNVNWAPRLLATWEPHSRLNFSAGYGRYYNKSMLTYALKSSEPDVIRRNRTHRGTTEIRNEDSPTRTPGYWEVRTQARPNYQSSGLRTPYDDEFTLGASYNDHLLNGTIRLNYIHRIGRDGFVKPSSRSNDLVNGGESKYDSISIEYAKSWDDLSVGPLDNLGFKVSASWSQRHKNNSGISGAFQNIDDTSYAFYNGKVYSNNEFDVVKGNLDIPIRGGLRMQAGLFEDRLKLWASADFTLPYDGVVKDTYITEYTVGGKTRKRLATRKTLVNVDGKSKSATNYVKKHFDFTTQVNVGGSYQLAKSKYGETVLTAKIDNVFNEKGHGTTDPLKLTNPFKKGRQFWLGLKTSF